jgi:hypothetical protein
MKTLKPLLLVIVILSAGSAVIAQTPEDLDPPRSRPTRTVIRKSPVGRAISPNTLYMNEFVSSSSRLFKVNSANAVATLVGSTFTPKVTDVAFQGTTLYGVTFNSFLSINPNNAQTTTIGSLGFNDINALVVNPANGKIYGAGSAVPGRFISINPTNGRGTFIGNFGTGLSSAGDLAFKNGVLYATLKRTGFTNSWLAKIAIATGKATLVGDIGFADVWGLSLRNGVLFGATRTGQLITINPTTGRGTFVNRNGIQQAGLTTSP